MHRPNVKTVVAVGLLAFYARTYYDLFQIHQTSKKIDRMLTQQREVLDPNPLMTELRRWNVTFD